MRALGSSLLIALWTLALGGAELEQAAPSASLVAEVQLPKGAPVPDALTVEARPLPEVPKSEEEPLEVVCPLSDHQIRCEIPAGRLDLKIAAPGFVPHYLWDLKATSGELVDLGTLELRHAASVAGWVLAPDGEPFEKPLRVELAPAFLGGGVERFPEEQRRTRVVHEVETTERGFFQFGDLDLGEYVVRVEGPEGYSPASRPEVQVREAREYVLDEPLIPKPLATLQVFIDPPMAPDEAPWKIVLHRRLPLSSASRKLTTESATPDGVWEKQGLPSGIYRVGLEDSAGSRHAERELEIDEGLATVRFELPFVPFEGWLRAGAEPIHARLELSGLDGTVVRLRTDSEGHFEGVVPHEGEWQAKVLPLEDRGSLFMRQTVQIDRVPGEEVSQVEIVLPATRLEGKVLDAEGEPATEALVTLFEGRRAAAQRYTDEEGRFQIMGLEAGLLKLRAESREGGDSGFVEIELDEDEVTEVELELGQARTIRFRVVSAVRPVAGAVVRLSDPDSAFGLDATSGPLGTFELRVPPGTRNLMAVLLAPGAPITLQNVDLPRTGNGPVDLQVAQAGGWLRFPPSQPLFLGQEELLPLRAFLRPFSGPNLREYDPQARLMKLEVAAGPWILCPEPQRSSRCASGYLAPGGVLDLTPRIERDATPTPESSLVR